MPVLLTTILVSYNTREMTMSCLKSLQADTDGIASEVIVVDNASGDGSASAIRAGFPDVTLIENSDNVGFSRAVNQGLRLAAGKFVMLLNPDCVVTPGMTDALTGYLVAHSDVGIVAPLITHPEGRLTVLSAGYLPNLQHLAVHYFGLSRVSLFGKHLHGLNLLSGLATQGPRDVEWVSGACLVASRTLFSDLGGLSDRWFMYAEDMDFCARAMDRGYRVVHLPSAHVTHEVGASSGGASTLWIENLEDFYVQRFHPSRLTLFFWRLTLALGLASRAAGYRVRAATRRDEAEAWKARANNFEAFARRSMRRRGSDRNG
jgi:N-acetylglucosaminyl-diphospho-decaprenol L-rhamnosyltransferase